MTTTDTQANAYLARFRTALTGMTLAEREDIVEEIRMHIRERAGEKGIDIDEVLAGLGPAEHLAEEYRTGLLLQQARRSISPLLILRATLRWARTGVEGTVVFFIALLGYTMGGAFLLLALLKPLFPHHTGLWVGPGVFDFSFHLGREYPSATVHEVLGWWFIPVCLVLGSLVLLATTKLIRMLTRQFRWRRPIAAAAHTPAAMVIAG
ncbi:MAG TPA: hypothetical protein VL240_04395 [Candidatus Binatia bacterium]|nr:hypothetical protein [Candidatus Binatia bacterium]